MSSSNGLIYCGLGVILAALAWPVAAEPVLQTHTEAMAQGWLRAGRVRLNAKMPGQVGSIETFSDFHVVHLAPDGFIVTAADDELEPVIAFSAHGRFEANTENPLWTLLNRDLPQRAARLRELRAKRTLPNRATVLSKAEADATNEGQRNRAKWQAFRNAWGTNASPVTLIGQVPAPANLGAAGLGDEPGETNTAPPVHIIEIKFVDEHVQLTHDGLSSVSILASYDSGQTWQMLDSGVVQSVWISKQPMREAGCWFRAEADGLYDEMTVAFMRNPSPALDTTPDVVGTPDPAAGASAPLGYGSLGSVSDIRVAPLVHSSWNQEAAQYHNCFNIYTPNNYVCGCVATALAQVLRYWQYPVNGIGQVSRTICVSGMVRTATTRGGNGVGGPYDWNAMPLVPNSVPYNLAQWQMIGSLCYDAGVSVNMNYSASGSGATMGGPAGAFTGVFQYADAHYIYWPPNLLLPIDSCLAGGCPVVLGISASGTSGHEIVCDGFGYDAGTLYHHLNLGWSGACDAWYALPAIGAYYGFNEIDAVIFNIFPTGAGELITGRIMTSQGAPVLGATVAASSGGSQNYTAKTDAKGYYGIKVPAGKTYTVTASNTGMSSATRSSVVVGTSSTSACGNVLGVDLTLVPFSFTAVALTNSVWLRWTAPTDCGMSNSNVYVRHRTDRFPTNSTDGTEVYRGTESHWVHQGVDATGTVTNYYAIWGNKGSPYAAFASSSQASAAAAPGRLKLYWISSSLGKAAVWLLQADGSKRSSGFVGDFTAGWNLVGTCDIDGDGVADLIWQNSSLGKVAYWLMDPDGVRRSSGTVATIASGWNYVGAGDLDGDGTPDLIWQNPALGKSAYWFLNADGSRRASGYVGDNATGWKPVGLADLNGDHTPDLIWQHPTQAKAAYWFLNSSGTSSSTGFIGDVTTGWNLVGVGDVDRDGTPDLIWHSPPLGKVAYWLLNTNATKRTSGYVGDVTPGWSLVGTGDIDGDGTIDLVWQSATVGKVAYWFLNPDGTKRSSGFSGNITPGWTLCACAPF